MAKSFKTAKIVKLFLDECKEYMDSLDQDLVSLEQGEADEEILNRISRNVHTIKGSSAMVEFMDISEIAHHIEDIFEEFKNKLPEIDSDLLDQFFDLADVIKAILDSIENDSYVPGAISAAQKQKPAPNAEKPEPVVEPSAQEPPTPTPTPAQEPPPSEESAPEPVEAKDAADDTAAETQNVTVKKPEKKFAKKHEKKKEKPTGPNIAVPDAGTRANLFEIVGEELRTALERCHKIFNDIDGKYILADENVDNENFINKLFDSITYLHRTLTCYGEPAVNEILTRILVLRDAMREGLIQQNMDTLDCIFKSVSHAGILIEYRLTRGKSGPPPDINSLLKKIHTIMAPLRKQKDYVSAEAAVEIFKHLSVDHEAGEFFTPYEKRTLAKSLIDSKNVFQIKMAYKLNELSDIASMSEFFKPLTEEGEYLSALIIALGEKGKKATAYDFFLLFATELSFDEFHKKYSYLFKIGDVEFEEIELALEAEAPEEEHPAVSQGQTQGKPGRRPRKKADKAAPRSTVRVDTEKLDVLVNLIAELVINHNKLEQETKRLKQGVNLVGEMYDNLKFSSKSTGLEERNLTREDIMKPFQTLQPEMIDLGAGAIERSTLENMKELRIIRENTTQLFDMELEQESLLKDMLTKVSLLKAEFEHLSTEFQDDALNIGRMIEELQEETMRLRMLPISGVFSKFPRRVRDIAKSLGKRIDFIIEGEDTELDKTLIEEIEEPLLHIIRNAVDHGIETRERRRESGKKENGTIWARAYHEGNSVVIEVQDDGKGIDPEMIARKCIEKRLISQEEADAMGPRDKMNLIFIPGFSTTDKVSDLSGRGVGMDVVKNSITKLKGTVDILSEVGMGSTLKLKLPLTLAIIQAMIVKCNNQKFVIPMDPIESTAQVSRYELSFVEGKEVYRHQEMVIPLVHLRDVYDLPELEKRTGSFPVVILGQAEKKFGLIVDEVLEKQQVVIKNLGSFLGDVKHMSGATIFGDGSIALILDVAGIVSSIPYISKKVEDRGAFDAMSEAKQVLLVDDSLSGRIAQREMLERIGYFVDVASSGMQALTKLTERKFDVIVTDINMPRMDGYEFTQKVRSKPDTSRIPIIMVTSDVKSADRNKAFEVGINEFLAKPFSEDDLRTAIDKHLRVF